MDACIDVCASLGHGATDGLRRTPTNLDTQCAFNIGYVSGHKQYFHPSPVER